jgi:hypoxanthine phosphoribosyltransferase
MAEDARQGKKILIVDDINDSGKTLSWIREDWGITTPVSPADNVSYIVPNIVNDNVRTACLIDNQASNFGEVDYTAMEINKDETPEWIVFPWEGERHYGNA